MPKSQEMIIRRNENLLEISSKVAKRFLRSDILSYLCFTIFVISQILRGSCDNWNSGMENPCRCQQTSKKARKYKQVINATEVAAFSAFEDFLGLMYFALSNRLPVVVMLDLCTNILKNILSVFC